VDHAVTLPHKVALLLGTWSRPPDVPAKIALAIAALFALMAMTGGGRHLLLGFGVAELAEARRLFPAEAEGYATANRRRFLALGALAAALLSVAYISSYLLGGPRIIDATTYFLQGRALSHGDLAWTPLEPNASFNGRFLLHREGANGPTLGGIFPPGYPLLLAFGFVLGAPMIVGPLLAGALVVATYRLARTLAEESLPELAEPIARGAALLSVFSAALRYHTADTMSHAASALGITIALTCAIDARRHRSSRSAIVAGLAVGYVVATRPASAAPIGLVTAWLVGREQPRLLVRTALGLLPGVALLLASQHAVTGSWLTSTQRMYYAASDGPPGCFRWGFGKGTGCLFEHGEFVQTRLADGYGIVQALATTLRRLWLHLLDVANLEPLAFLVLVPSLVRRRAPSTAVGVFAATALVGLQMLAYVPFYFDGNYPGGGARFFADVLPVEHALVMLGVACLIVRKGARGAGSARGSESSLVEARVVRGVLTVLSLAAVGFAVHASYEHGKLRDRDGGPMFEPDALTRANLTRGLVFVDTDHGFGLGHDPEARPESGIVVARFLQDDRDRLLFEALQRPPTYVYKLEPNPAAPSRTTASLTPWVPPDASRQDVFRFEAESEWPVLTQTDGFAVPVWVHGCAGNKRALVLTPTGATPTARATFDVPVPSAGRWSVEVHIVRGATVPFATTRPMKEGDGRVLLGNEAWSWTSVRPQEPPKGGDPCASLGTKELELKPPHAPITIEATGGSVAVDAMTLRSLP
jgi:hypothetical protein